MVGETHSHPFHIIALVHNIVPEEARVEFHFSLEEGGTLPDVVVENFLPSLGLADILALQEDVVGLDKALEMRDGTIFLLHHLVGFRNENLLVVHIHAGGPHLLELVENLLSLLLTVFRNAGVEFLHLLNRFGGVTGERSEPLCIR